MTKWIHAWACGACCDAAPAWDPRLGVLRPAVLTQVPSWEAAEVAVIVATLLASLDASSPLSHSRDPLLAKPHRAGDNFCLTIFFFFYNLPNLLVTQTHLRRNMRPLRCRWVWRRALSQAFLRVKKAANSFCDILPPSGDLHKAQGVLYLFKKKTKKHNTTKAKNI